MAVVAALFLISGGCSKDAPLAPGRGPTLVVHVSFPDEGPRGESPKSERAADAADIEEIRAFAFAVQPGAEDTLRATSTAAISSENRSFELTLDVPPGNLYRIEVHAVGTRESTLGASERGILFAGDALVDDVIAGSRRTVEIFLRDMVPELRLTPEAGAPLGLRLDWTRIEGALRYRLRERPSGREFVSTDTSLVPGAAFGPDGASEARSLPMQALSYRVRSEDARLVSAFSESVAVEAAAACSLSTNSLDFGVASIGSARDLTFSIVNTGFGPLVGTVRAECEHFTVTQGAGAYELLRGAARTVTVRFAPQSAGAHACDIDPGGSCGLVHVTGTGEALPACSVEPPSLDFGTVVLGSSASQSFVITNAGGGRLTGSVPAACGDFLVSSGEGAFDLGAGETRTVHVTFVPESPGAQSCDLALGTGGCAAVSLEGTGEPQAVCDLDTQALDFGTVTVGEFATRSFRVLNSGGSVLTGTVGASCPEFAIESGGGAYALAAGESIEVVVRFTPASPGEKSCEIDAGVSCGIVAANGTGDPPAACEVTPPGGLDFGTVDLGDSLSIPFTIRNGGGGRLSGTVSESCDDFRIEGEPVAYDLGAGDAIVVTVWFAPSEAGQRFCDIETGAACAAVPASGAGYLAPLCSVVPASLDFGSVGLDDSEERSIVVRNVGGDVLEGTVTSPCPEFEIVPGTGSYTLGPGASDTVRVVFHPSATGVRACTLETGSALCTDVAASGLGLAPCTLSATEIDFGSVYVNATADHTFSITNTGTLTLTGNVTESCAHFSIVSGGGAFALAPGGQRSVTVRFAPAAAGAHSCNVSTGSTYCGDVTLRGTGLATCGVSPKTFAFGRVSTGGSYRDLTFTITNTGSQTLSGSVSESCADFTILGEFFSYNIAPGASRDFTVRFTPGTTGQKLCTIDTGTFCDPIVASGEGTVPSCIVDPPTLIFSTYDFNSVPDQSFTLTNTGQGLLRGTVFIPGGGDCANFVLTTPGAYVLQPGGQANFTVRFLPQSYGSFACVLGTGSGNCPETLQGYNVIGKR